MCRPIHWLSQAIFIRIENPRHSSKVSRAENKFVASHGNAGKCRWRRLQNKRFLHAVSRSKFVAIFGSDIRPLLAILGLLLCSIATRADELPVIKDSEAIHYVGKKVEVRGFVGSVMSSPLGTTFIN